MNKLIKGDTLTCLRKLQSESVQTCICSPPYWGLRDYGVAGQLGLEPTPEAYVARMVEVFAEVRRVLRDDGVLFLNIGDSYMGGGPHHGEKNLGKSGSNQGSASGVDRVGAQREVSCGTSGKAPEVSQDCGCLCGSLCDACRKAYQTGKAHSDPRHDPRLIASPCEPSREHKGSEHGHSPTSDSSRRVSRNGVSSRDSGHNGDLANGRPRVAHQSNPGGSSRQPRGGCSPTSNDGVCLLCGRSLEPCVPQFSGKTASPCESKKVSLSTQDLAVSKNGKASIDDAFGCRNADKSCDSSYQCYGTTYRHVTLKPKDLCGIPWRLAFALQADGWYLRSDIIWHKPNPMPESVRDRPTKAHEYIFLLSKSAVLLGRGGGQGTGDTSDSGDRFRQWLIRPGDRQRPESHRAMASWEASCRLVIPQHPLCLDDCPAHSAALTSPPSRPRWSSAASRPARPNAAAARTAARRGSG